MRRRAPPHGTGSARPHCRYSEHQAARRGVPISPGLPEGPRSYTTRWDTTRARDFAAWLGLTPTQHTTGGKHGLGATTKMGQRSLRRLLVLGVNTVVIKRPANPMAQPGIWLGGLLARKPGMLVRVALAN